MIRRVAGTEIGTMLHVHTTSNLRRVTLEQANVEAIVTMRIGVMSAAVLFVTFIHSARSFMEIEVIAT
jgi:hypothetical protein